MRLLVWLCRSRRETDCPRNRKCGARAAVRRGCGRSRGARSSCCLLVLIVSTSSCLAQHVAVADWGGEAPFRGLTRPCVADAAETAVSKRENLFSKTV